MKVGVGGGSDARLLETAEPNGSLHAPQSGVFLAHAHGSARPGWALKKGFRSHGHNPEGARAVGPEASVALRRRINNIGDKVIRPLKPRVGSFFDERRTKKPVRFRSF